MTADVETPVESDLRIRAGGTIHLRILGPMAVARQGVPLELPASRKVRALIAYLALAPDAVARRDLCELFWDVPNDPRGELRWCLSKVRRVLDEPGSTRVESCGDAIRFDLSHCFVDAIEVARTIQEGTETLSLERLRALSNLFGGDFLDGLEFDRHPHFQGWLLAQRRRFRGCHIALMEHLIRRTGESDEVFVYVEKWLNLTPFDLRAHEVLLNGLARRGRLLEGEEHLAATVELFEAEGLEWAPLREVWRAAKSKRNIGLLPAQADPGPVSARLISDGGIVVSTAPRRASIAVMPFVDQMGRGRYRGGLADGLAHDVITRLAKLRSLFVIAQGSVFALDERNIGPEEAGRTLNVDYLVSGSVRRHAHRIRVSAELTATRTARIVWAEVFDTTLNDAFRVLDEIGDRIVASTAIEIETIERNRALLKPPNSLDAWEACHRGLWHMYRSTRADNDLAQQFFQAATRLDPTFVRAYAGLSFTHFQNARMYRIADRPLEIEWAEKAAKQALIIDDRDPAAHCAMGRALWLRGCENEALPELVRAIELSPSFAVGHYTLGLVHAQWGDPQRAIQLSDQSRLLSPFDPLLFAMLAVRAVAHLRLDQFEDAADWAIKAARRPNIHVHIPAIAAHCLALAGRLDEARAFIASVHQTHPHYRFSDLLAAHRPAPDLSALFRRAADRIGLA